MSATARVTILMDPAEKQALEERARAREVSVGELARNTLFPSPNDEEEMLLAAIDLLRESNRASLEALDRTLASLREREAAAQAKEVEVRRAAQKEVAQWSVEQRAWLRYLLPPVAGSAA